jgi:hypothetical protein
MSVDSSQKSKRTGSREKGTGVYVHDKIQTWSKANYRAGFKAIGARKFIIYSPDMLTGMITKYYVEMITKQMMSEFRRTKE